MPLAVKAKSVVESASGDVAAEQAAWAKKCRRADFVVDSSQSFDHVQDAGVRLPSPAC